MPTLMTIERHILEQQKRHPEATGALTHILYDMALSAKLIARETTRAGIGRDLMGKLEGQQNPTGDIQHRLDVFAHDMIFKMNDHTGLLCVMASEEREDIMPIPEQFEVGNYVLIFDPLDGSSNIDVNASTGTIFSIYRRVTPSGGRGTLEDCLQAGRQIVAAGYVAYSASTMMVYSTGEGVHGFTLDPSLGEFLLSHPNIQTPAKPTYYSINHKDDDQWLSGIQAYVQWLRNKSQPDSPALSQRYVGALVADFHRNLLHGGVFLYPGDASRPHGKLRLLYEAIPLAYLMAQAGGYASDGVGDILDVQPQALHQRTPLIIGDKGLVEAAEGFLRRHNPEWVAEYAPLRSQK
jgi:fructose-1,6-bisphosphatase I